MGEAEIKFLKLKCNKLIEKALQLEKEIEKRDVQIGQLMEKKKLLEAQILSEPEEKGQGGEEEIFSEKILSLPQVRQGAAESESLAALANDSIAQYADGRPAGGNCGAKNFNRRKNFRAAGGWSGEDF